MAEFTTADIDRLVFEKLPQLRLVEVVAAASASLYLGKESAPDFSSQLAALEAARAKLLALPDEELKSLVASSRARELAARHEQAEKTQAIKDATRFFNQPQAAADFSYWCRLDYWTLNEGVALLLGRDPHVVNPEALHRELTQNTGFLGRSTPPQRSGFHQTYEQLRTLIDRADGLNNDRMKPAELLAWATKTKAIRLPEKLVQIIDAKAREAAPASDQAPASAAPPGGRKLARAARPWNEAELEELKNYKKVHGTEQAAKHFEISGSRVRKLLSSTAEKPSPFPTPFKSFMHRLK